MHLFLTKVAVKSCIYAREFSTTVIDSSDFLHIMLNISKHYLARNGDLLPAVCAAC